VLMPKHYHLIVQLGPEANWSRGRMQWLQTSYAWDRTGAMGEWGPSLRA